MEVSAQSEVTESAAPAVSASWDDTFLIRTADGPGNLYVGRVTASSLAPFVPVGLRDAYAFDGPSGRECAGRVAAVWSGATVENWGPQGPPRQLCEQCNVGPFYLVPTRNQPTLCLDCAQS